MWTHIYFNWGYKSRPSNRNTDLKQCMQHEGLCYVYMWTSLCVATWEDLLLIVPSYNSHGNPLSLQFTAAVQLSLAESCWLTWTFVCLPQSALCLCLNALCLFNSWSSLLWAQLLSHWFLFGQLDWWWRSVFCSSIQIQWSENKQKHHSNMHSMDSLSQLVLNWRAQSPRRWSQSFTSIHKMTPLIPPSDLIWSPPVSSWGRQDTTEINTQHICILLYTYTL